MAYIGNSPANVGNYQVVDNITTFNGTLTSFALTANSQAITPAKSGQLLVSLNGVLQEPDDTGTDGFKVSGSNIVFSSAPATGSTFWCVYQGQNVDIGTPSDGTVGTDQMSYPLANFTSTGIDDNADATAITITSSEHIGIGTASPAIMEGRQAGKFLTVYGTATNGGILELASNKNTDNDSVGIVSFVNTENGDTNGASRKYIAQIRGKVETNDSNAQDDSGGNLVFQTKANGGTIDDRLTITSDGRGLSQFTAKAWSTHNQNGTLSVGDSHNVSSITDVGTGNFRLNFSNNMGGTNYTWTGFCTYWGSSYNDASNMEQDYADSNSGNQNNNNLALHTMANINNATTSTIADMAVVNVVVFGD